MFKGRSGIVLAFGGVALFRAGAVLLLFVLQILSVHAKELALQSLGFSVLSGRDVQLQLEMNGPAVEPKVFQTDNPARIALDFVGVKSALQKKLHPVNIGVVSSVYALEASGRLRVIINLLDSVPYQTEVVGNMVYVTLKRGPQAEFKAETLPGEVKGKPKDVSELIPEQAIRDLDFRRGPHGEGRLLVSLSNPDTVVDMTEKGGKVVINFLNTRLPKRLSKRVDVLDFATPVQYIDVTALGSKTRITVTLVDGNYEYSSYQTEGLLTVEFRPLTAEEKERRAKKKFTYTGERLSLNFQNIEVRSVLQILADFTKLNIVVSDSVDGSVTLRLDDVPWDQALDVILRAKDLGKKRTGNVIWVAPLDEIKVTVGKESEIKKREEENEPIKTEYIQINYAKAENFRNLLFGLSAFGNNGCSVIRQGGGNSSSGGGSGSSSGKGSSVGGFGGGTGNLNTFDYRLLSKRGTAIVDSRTNTLIVKDIAESIENIREMIALLDKPVRQVLIESRIVIANDNFAKELGVNLGIEKRNNPSNPNDTLATLNGLVDLATASTPHGTLAMTLLRAGDYLLNLEITALQDEGKGEVLSNPRVLTTDRCEAMIKQGLQIPYLSVSQNGTQTELVDAVLELRVTPQITPSGSVIMDLNIKKDKPGQALVQGGQAPIDKREIQTTARVDDGETVVLGGVYEGTTLNATNKVPFFSDIPGIGWLFTRTVDKEDKQELLIFVTPKIVRDSLSTH